MLTNRADHRCVLSDMNMSAIDAFPNDDSVSLKDFTFVESVCKSSVTLLMYLLDLGDPFE